MTQGSPARCPAQSSSHHSACVPFAAQTGRDIAFIEACMQLLQILQQKNVVRGEDLSSIQQAQKANPQRPLHAILIEQGFAKEEDLLPVLADQLGMDLVDLNKVTIHPET